MENKFKIKRGFLSEGNGTITGSLTITQGVTGSFSGSFQGDGSGLTGVEPFPFTGSALITGSLVVTGSIYTDSTIYSPFTIGLDFETVETFIYRSPYNFKVTSIESDPSQSIEILYQASGSAVSSSYSFGSSIDKFDKLHITPVSESLVILYSEKI